MRFHEIVISDVESNRSFEIFEFFAERQRKAGKALAVCPHREVRSFDVGRADVRGVRHSNHTVLYTAESVAGLYLR